jgi:hypothetical protein
MICVDWWTELIGICFVKFGSVLLENGLCLKINWFLFSLYYLSLPIYVFLFSLNFILFLFNSVYENSTKRMKKKTIQRTKRELQFDLNEDFVWNLNSNRKFRFAFACFIIYQLFNKKKDLILFWISWAWALFT